MLNNVFKLRETTVDEMPCPAAFVPSSNQSTDFLMIKENCKPIDHIIPLNELDVNRHYLFSMSPTSKREIYQKQKQEL